MFPRTQKEYPHSFPGLTTTPASESLTTGHPISAPIQAIPFTGCPVSIPVQASSALGSSNSTPVQPSLSTGCPIFSPLQAPLTVGCPVSLSVQPSLETVSPVSKQASVNTGSPVSLEKASSNSCMPIRASGCGQDKPRLLEGLVFHLTGYLECMEEDTLDKWKEVRERKRERTF